jgi:hypothetical protein
MEAIIFTPIKIITMSIIKGKRKMVASGENLSGWDPGDS